jgi:signal peptidase I
MTGYSARSHQLAKSRTVHRSPRPWLAALLSLLQPGLGHLYLWRVRLAVTMWAISTAAGVVSLWTWTSARWIGVQLAVLLMVVAVNIAIASHAWWLAHSSRATVRPARARLVAVLVTVYAILFVASSVRQRWIRRNVIQPYRIGGGSMEPNLLAGDWVFVSHKREPPRRDRMAVFTAGADTVLLRIAGLPGDTLAMRDGVLMRNGARVDGFASATIGPDETADEFAWQSAHLLSTVDPRSYHPTTDNWGPLVVPPERLFMLGDNRHGSNDSRFSGFVATERVIGRPTEIYFSFDPLDHVTRWNRIGRRVDP